MSIKPKVVQAIENGILYWFVYFVDGTSVRFNYGKHGFQDAVKYVGMKTMLGEVETSQLWENG